MECSRCNQNAHYANRNGRNMVNNSMNSGRNNCSNMTQNRSVCNNMNHRGNACGNMNSSGDACGNMNRNRNSSGAMNPMRHNCGNMGSGRNNESNMERRNCGCSERNEKKGCSCQENTQMKKCDEGCDRGKEPVDKMMPAMAYVPWQQWEDIYCMEEGFERGTVFAQLDKPFIGRSAR